MAINKLKKIIKKYFENQDVNESLVIVAGPTGIGKSYFAIKLALEINGVIINADSIQVYKNIEIMSSQPNKNDLTKVDHFLYGFKSINEHYSVGDWLHSLNHVLKYIKSKKKIPILVGGTGMYIDAAINGLSDIPAIEEDIKLKTNIMFETLGVKKFREIVGEIDPVYYSQNKDKQRLIRAYNVFISTGKSLTDWHKSKSNQGINRKTFSILLNKERKENYKNCDSRFETFIKTGGLDEVRRFWEKKIDRSLSSAKALGIKWFLEFYDGKISLKNAMEYSKRDTRRYVKRQNTWFKNNFVPNIKIYL